MRFLSTLYQYCIGSGARLFEHLDEEHIQLETIEVLETPTSIHLRFPIIK